MSRIVFDCIVVADADDLMGFLKAFAADDYALAFHRAAVPEGRHCIEFRRKVEP